MNLSLTKTFSKLTLLFTVGLLASCGGGGLSSTGGSAGTGSGAGSGGGGSSISFSMGDLNGDWTGELIPDNRQLIRRNLYVRVANGEVTDSAEGGGGEWNGSNANITLEFTNQGFFDVAAASNAGKGDMSLEGTMNVAMNRINGTVRIVGQGGGIYEGTFELRRSSGAGHFGINLVKGTWSGQGSNSRDKFRIASIEIDQNGVVQDAEVLHPVTSALVHTYSSGAGTLNYFDDAVGRMNNVVITADDGSTLSFDFLLVNDEGTLITGVGADSVLGEGRIELTL